MKKNYMSPKMEINTIGTQSMICVSGVYTSDYGIEYGGIDTNGEKEPGSRRRNSVWDDEEDEDW